MFAALLQSLGQVCLSEGVKIHMQRYSVNSSKIFVDFPISTRFNAPFSRESIRLHFIIRNREIKIHFGPWKASFYVNKPNKREKRFILGNIVLRRVITVTNNDLKVKMRKAKAGSPEIPRFLCRRISHVPVSPVRPRTLCLSE